jgi:hypothetical protein
MRMIMDAEHEPFRGQQYKVGGLIIWGFSHHRGPDDADTPDFTYRTVTNLALSGEHWFFNRIRRFFGDQEPNAFWNSVAFANTLPTAVPSDTRYSDGTAEQRGHVKRRVRRILTELRPGRAVLFSTKGWPLWPELNGSVPEPAQVLMTGPELRYGSYDFGTGSEIKAFSLPHPMLQTDVAMKERVQRLMAH